MAETADTAQDGRTAGAGDHADVPGWAQAAPTTAAADAPQALPSSAAATPGPVLPPAPRAPRRPLDLAPGADPRGTRLMLAALLAVTAVAWLWNLDRNGWGNTFYAAAVQAGTQSWKAFFFGSFDAGSYITVDKPPVSLWVMALSGRLFGFSSWSLLAPNVLLGVGSVALLFAAVRRAWGAAAGLLAAAALAVTPVAALMFRFDNPDAALTFLLVASAWAMTRALEHGRWRWLVAAAALVGTAFLAKSLQALLVVPGLGLAHLVAAPGGAGRRVGRLLAGGGVMAVAGLWWMLLVDAIPASARPFVGGSTDDSTLSLALGFNGLGRLTGAEGGGPGGPGGRGGGPAGGGPGAGFGGTPGLGRMFNALFGGEVAWLLPAALLMLLAGLWLTRRAPRTDPRRASLLLWGGWLVVTAGVFSFMNGIVHTYYTVALAPAVAALAGMLLPALWRNRTALLARLLLVAALLLTAGTAFVLLGRAEGWLPWLRWAVVAVALVAAAGLLVAPGASVPAPPADAADPSDASGPTGPARNTRGRRVAGAVAGLAVLSAVAAPAAWSVQTIGTTHTGSIPASGPAVRGGGGFGGFARGDFDRFRRDGGFTPGQGGQPGGQPGAQDGQLGQPGTQGQQGVPPQGFPQGGVPQGGFPGGGGPGGALQADPALVTLVSQDAATYTWVAAAGSSMEAGPLQLASGHPVMSLGGFNGQDPAITLDRFKALVAAGKVHYYIGGGREGFGGGPGRGGAQQEIAQWVEQTFTAQTVGGRTVYDLTAPAA